MNVEAYNLDSLRALVRSLQDENQRLKMLLDQANVVYETENIFGKKADRLEAYDPDQGGRILDRYITKDLANQFFFMFWGRTDVYARRGAKGGYFPQCDNRWDNRVCPKQRGEKINCEDCGHTEWTVLTPEKIINHLVGYREDGTDVLGIYPLFPDGTCQVCLWGFGNSKRGDNLEKLIYMLIGPIRHSYTAKERAMAQGIGHYVYPRYTRVVDTRESRDDINRAYSLISSSTVRNDMILDDTRTCVQEGRTPVILTRYKEQAKYLYDHLQTAADHVFILYGDNSDKQNSDIRQKLKEVPKDQSLILIATGQKI